MARRRRLPRRRLLRRMLVPATAAVLVLLVAVLAATLAMSHGSQRRDAAAGPATASATASATNAGDVAPSLLGSALSSARTPAASSQSAHPALRSNDCGPDPHLCGFPDATNTGPSGGLTPVSGGASGPGWSADSQGNVEVSGDGAVFAGYSVHGVVDVTGSNAVVKGNSISNYGSDVDGDGVNLSGNPSNVTIENNSISSPYGSTGGMGVFAGIKDINGEAMGTRVLDNNIADASTGIQLYIGLIEGNYIHDIASASPGDHLNGTTSNGSTVPLTIQHNTVFNPNGQTDAISLFEDFGVEANVVINDNLVAGGGYTIYGGQNAGGPQAYNIRITNNRFSTIYYSEAGYYGYITAFDQNAPGNVWSGNVWDSTGNPVSS